MAIAETSQTRLAIIKESSWGVTPTTPVFRKLRTTGWPSLKHNRGNVQSDEIRPDGNVADLIQVSGGAEGGFDFELSYGAFDDLLAGALRTTWAADKIKNGIEKHSFTIEDTATTGGSKVYTGYQGLVVNTMSLNVPLQEKVTGSFGLMGKGGYVSDSIISGATYVDSADNDVMSAGLNFANLSISGVSSPNLTGLTLEINNNVRMQPVIGSIDAVGVGLGRFQCSGSVSMYFEGKAAYELFLNGTASDLSFDLTKDGNKYTFRIPRLKFSDANKPVNGNDADLILELPFVGLYDPTLQATLEIERTAVSGS